MPWKYRSRRVSVCAPVVAALMWATLPLVVACSPGARARFVPFYHGDVSSYLAEAWYVSMPLLGLASALALLVLAERHPLRTLDLVLSRWNVAALCTASASMLGLLGVAVVACPCPWNEACSPPLESAAGHGFFLCLCFPGMILYELLHAGALLHDAAFVARGEGRAWAQLVAAAQLALAGGQAAAMAFWVSEMGREQFYDDPSCDKSGEWIAAFLVGLFFLTLPALTQCVPMPGDLPSGTALSSGALVVDEPFAHSDLEMGSTKLRFCQNCGQPVTGKFCASCGAAMEAAPGAPLLDVV